jgi:hypothetical protein
MHLCWTSGNRARPPTLLAHAALYIGGKLTTVRVTRDGAEIVQTADLDALAAA